ncbi:serine/threonine-protein kinase fused [Nilaparvata lugens]|uniref:serine/threonine-protein kinase fused n=1 Tax=Nilaparvata lugens TaxID=108931 RepID=UPI00193D335F|nr:serine/threonine-protein kinase fused [Nilaparvata lugens]
MDKYELVGMVGEGSFGRVYKGRIIETDEIIALKIISKCGRSMKELASLRSECEVQRDLCHPNIIKMIDSFETEGDIVVVTEYANRELSEILSQEGYLEETRARKIICDLVSALFYLHSNRVLHRDLKPQNVLIDDKGTAKLCDFGFARSMSTGTHVLTSIKGTPLYMAPELIEESPYDHNADLWSLGCIAYEMIVGATPFTTTSILHLVQLLRYESVKWPTFVSAACLTFLQGLLEKDPARRLSWPQLLDHPFIKGSVIVSNEEGGENPLTSVLTTSQSNAKENQMKDLVRRNSRSRSLGKVSYTPIRPQEFRNAPTSVSNTKEMDLAKKRGSADSRRLSNVEIIGQKLGQIDLNFPDKGDVQMEVGESCTREHYDSSMDGVLNSSSQSVPSALEVEEWLAFVSQSLREALNSEVEAMAQTGFVAMFTKALTTYGRSSKVTEYIAHILSLPFVGQRRVDNIEQVYLEVKAVPNLVHAIRLQTDEIEAAASSAETVSAAWEPSDEALAAIEIVCVLLTYLVHCDSAFLDHFCDAAVMMHMAPRLQFLLSQQLRRRKLRIVNDLVAILTLVLVKKPENSKLVEDVILMPPNSDSELHAMLTHSSDVLRTRTCYLLKMLAHHCSKALQNIWSKELENDIESLEYDSDHSVRLAAEDALEELKKQPFFTHTSCDFDQE